ncbi:MAG: hypothetical protein PHT69_05250 [Bacteroidales bacterium]|nr:hypothetical protein [Bacteroidales bacterium]
MKNNFFLLFFFLSLNVISQNNIIDYYTKSFKPPFVFDKNTIRHFLDTNNCISSNIVKASFNSENDTIITFSDSDFRFFPLFKIESENFYGLFSYLETYDTLRWQVDYGSLYLTIFSKEDTPKVYHNNNFGLYNESRIGHSCILYWYNDTIIYRYSFNDNDKSISGIQYNKLNKENETLLAVYSPDFEIDKGFSNFVLGSFLKLETPIKFETEFYSNNFLFFQITDSLVQNRLLIWKRRYGQLVNNFVLNPLFCFDAKDSRYFVYLIKWQDYDFYGYFSIKINVLEKDIQLFDNYVDRILELSFVKDASNKIISIDTNEIIVKDTNNNILKRIQLQ